MPGTSSPRTRCATLDKVCLGTRRPAGAEAHGGRRKSPGRGSRGLGRRRRLQQLVRSEKRGQSGGRGGAAAGATAPDAAASAPGAAASASHGRRARGHRRDRQSKVEYPALLEGGLPARRHPRQAEERARRGQGPLPVARDGGAAAGPASTVDAEAMQAARRCGAASSCATYLSRAARSRTERLFLGAPKTAGSEASWTPRADLKIGT